jgi:hypothetical protein
MRRKSPLQSASTLLDHACLPPMHNLGRDPAPAETVPSFTFVVTGVPSHRSDTPAGQCMERLEERRSAELLPVPDRPWLGERACNCGGAGDPCPICNHADEDNVPAMLEGFVADPISCGRTCNEGVSG